MGAKHLQIKNLSESDQQSLVDLCLFLDTATNSKAAMIAVNNHKGLVLRIKTLEKHLLETDEALTIIYSDISQYFDLQDKIRLAKPSKS